MLNMSWFSEYKGEVKTISFYKDSNPYRKGLGHYADVNGNVWHVKAVIGEYVCARLIKDYPDYYSTGIGGSSFSSTITQDYIHTWNPYKVELIDREEKEVG